MVGILIMLYLFATRVDGILTRKLVLDCTGIATGCPMDFWGAPHLPGPPSPSHCIAHPGPTSLPFLLLPTIPTPTLWPHLPSYKCEELCPFQSSNTKCVCHSYKSLWPLYFSLSASISALSPRAPSCELRSLPTPS